MTTNRQRRRPQTPQDRTRRRVEAHQRTNDQEGLRIVGLTYEERNHVRERVFYSGASDTEVATTMRHLGLAVAALIDVREGAVVVERTDDGFRLR